MRIIAITTSGILLLASILWASFKPDWDSAIAVLVAIISLATSFLLKKDKEVPPQSQIVSGGSSAIQAGRDVKIKK